MKKIGLKTGIIAIIIIAIVVAAMTAIILASVELPEKEKNPNIQYFEKNTVKISGNNSDELAKNIAEMRRNCWIDDTMVIPEAVNNGTIKSSIIARTNDCAAKYK